MKRCPRPRDDGPDPFEALDELAARRSTTGADPAA